MVSQGCKVSFFISHPNASENDFPNVSVMSCKLYLSDFMINSYSEEFVLIFFPLTLN